MKNGSRTPCTYVGRKEGLLCSATFFLNLGSQVDDFKALPSRAKDIAYVEIVSHYKNVHSSKEISKLRFLSSCDDDDDKAKKS